MCRLKHNRVRYVRAAEGMCGRQAAGAATPLPGPAHLQQALQQVGHHLGVAPLRLLRGGGPAEPAFQVGQHQTKSTSLCKACTFCMRL